MNKVQNLAKAQEIKPIVSGPCTLGGWTHKNSPWFLLGWLQGHLSGERQRSPNGSAWGMRPSWLGWEEGTQRLRFSTRFGAQRPFGNIGRVCDSVQLQEEGQFCKSPPKALALCGHTWRERGGWLFLHLFDHLAVGHLWLLPSHQPRKWCAGGKEENATSYTSPKKSPT